MNNQIINYHLSYYTLDPIQGCPNNCSYCLWKPYNLTSTITPPIIKPAALISELKRYLSKYKYSSKSLFPYIQVPISIGNMTDMCVNKVNIDYLFSFLELYKNSSIDLPVLIQTKAVLNKNFFEILDSFDTKIIIAISAAFNLDEEMIEESISPSFRRIESFKYLIDKKNLVGIHFWRPAIDSPQIGIKYLVDIITKLNKSKCSASVFSGLMIGDKLKGLILADPKHPLFLYVKNHQLAINKDMLMPSFTEVLFNVARDLGYPLYFRQTSCAISFVLNQQDYYSTFRKTYANRCLASSCPFEQRNRCIKFYNNFRHPDNKIINLISHILNISIKYIHYDQETEEIIINKTLPQETQNYLSHITGFLVKARSVISNSQWDGTHVR